MSGQDKTVAIVAVGFFGMLGTTVVGWPAVACAAIAIVAIALAKGEDQ